MRVPASYRRAWGPALAGVAGLGLALAALNLASPDRIAHSEPARIDRILIDAAPVAFQAEAAGRFAFAGAVHLTSPETSRLHGLSDLKVWPDGRLLAVTDDGDFLEARLQLDEDGRPAGLADARLTPIPGEDGQPLSNRGKSHADAEGVAVLADGSRLVSFEGQDLVLAFPADGGPPRPAPGPGIRFPENFGMEALSADPERGPDAYLVGGEVNGRLWSCRLSGACAEEPKVGKGLMWGLVAVEPLPGGRRAYLLRALDVWFGRRARLRIVDAEGRTVDELAISRPMPLENYEGLAAVPQSDGSVRFYLVSDDNFDPGQRTLLLAFDWKAPAP